MNKDERDLEELYAQVEDLKEDLFLLQTDLEKARIENIAMKNFIQNVYESCEELESETNLSLEDVIKNLKQNIRQFSKQHNIRL